MELVDFFRILKRKKYILIVIPLITAVAAYFIVHQLPDLYDSRARIATGLVDQSLQQQIVGRQSNTDESKINQQFSNIIELMRLKKIVNQVSYQLIIHDLSAETPFRKPSKELKDLTKEERSQMLAEFQKYYDTHAELSLLDNAQNKLNNVLNSMQYDAASLTQKFKIYRVSNSDFIDVEYESENPYQSAFVVNTLCKEFLNYYSFITREDELKAVDFLSKLLQEKYAAMNNKMDQLKTYKIKNRVLNLNEQARAMYGQIADFETRKRLVEKEIEGDSVALANLNAKFNPKDRKFLESASSIINQQIVDTKAKLQALNDSYIRSNYDEQYKKSIDSIKPILYAQIEKASDNISYNPLSAKQSLVEEKLKMEITLDMARQGYYLLDDEIKRLNKKMEGLVPHEAMIQGYENSIDIAEREYLEILQKFNQTSMESNLTVQLKQVEMAIPGVLQPSKKFLLIIASAIASFVLCVVVFFVLFYFDNSINKSKTLANRTFASVLGYLPILKSKNMDILGLWTTSELSSSNKKFKDMLRSTRFEIDREMGSGKILTVTSLHTNEGKTTIAASLAYAHAMTGKKVLLIDGNLSNPSISERFAPTLFIEDYFTNKAPLNNLDASGKPFAVIGNKGSDYSLLELSMEATIKQKLQILSGSFDIIIIEASALETLNKSREWIIFSDKVITVFEASKTIREQEDVHVEYLKGLGKQWIGWVMNKADRK
ncbi:exopolysaccharide transport family protein [Chitinophagaceae bacterium LWZ2-11]